MLFTQLFCKLQPTEDNSCNKRDRQRQEDLMCGPLAAVAKGSFLFKEAKASFDVEELPMYIYY